MIGENALFGGMTEWCKGRILEWRNILNHGMIGQRQNVLKHGMLLSREDKYANLKRIFFLIYFNGVYWFMNNKNITIL